jgi:hypothetical protein
MGAVKAVVCMTVLSVTLDVSDLKYVFHLDYPYAFIHPGIWLMHKIRAFNRVLDDYHSSSYFPSVSQARSLWCALDPQMGKGLFTLLMMVDATLQRQSS